MWAFVGRRAGRIVVSAVALSAGVAGIAYATIPDGNGVYTACMLNKVGTIRLIDPSLPASNLMSHCTRFESRMTFNQQGQPGPQGVPGKDGAPGASGNDGVSPTVTQLAAGDTHCSAGGAAIRDAGGNTAYVCNGTDGTNGQPFSGRFTSPSGQYSVDVADGGITLTGPGTSVRLGAGTLELDGTSIALNPLGCAPAARQNDPVSVSGNSITGQPGDTLPLIITSSMISQGSTSVCIG